MTEQVVRVVDAAELCEERGVVELVEFADGWFGLRVGGRLVGPHWHAGDLATAFRYFHELRDQLSREADA